VVSCVVVVDGRVSYSASIAGMAGDSAVTSAKQVTDRSYNLQSRQDSHQFGRLGTTPSRRLVLINPPFVAGRCRRLRRR
jgi:hypothetical protein